jgi:hypothetical protein
MALSAIAIFSQMNADNTKTVELQVSGQGNWSGFYVNQDSRIDVNGSGNAVFYLNRPSNATVWNVIVRIYEIGPSNYTLTVRIATVGGQVLNEDYASSVGTSALATFTITPVFCIGNYYKCLSQS